jgi:hypothetical protein
MLRYSMISLLSLLPSCQATMEGSASEDDDDAAFQLKSYEVPAGYESRVEDVLNRVFWRGDNVPLLGRAHQGAPGSVIVAAPASVQEEVGDVIARLNKLDPKVAEPKNVELSYWMIGGHKGAAVDIAALPADIAPAIAQVAASEAPMTYSVLTHQTLRSLDGAHARVTSPDLQISQVASVGPAGGIVADIEIDAPGGVGTKTQVRLADGQVLVLGQVATGGGPGPSGTSDAIFYVVRPEPPVAQ